MIIDKAIFAAGCFWGVQSIFESVSGVISTQVGYVGGLTESPSYSQVSTGKTGHAEAVEVVFDPNIVSYNQLLDVFFKAHNPTTLNRQGPDIGKQYRSGIFYNNIRQKEEAIAKIAYLNHLGKYSTPIVTEISAAGNFYPAEEYHQHYLSKRGQTSCSLGEN